MGCRAKARQPTFGGLLKLVVYFLSGEEASGTDNCYHCESNNDDVGVVTGHGRIRLGGGRSYGVGDFRLGHGRIHRLGCVEGGADFEGSKHSFIALESEQLGADRRICGGNEAQIKIAAHDRLDV